MMCNVGNKEKNMRMALGIAIIFTGAIFRKKWGFLGIIPLLTGRLRYCPLNALFGINNCEKEDDKDKDKVRIKEKGERSS